MSGEQRMSPQQRDRDPVFITPSVSITQALKQLDKAATKVLLVVDDSLRLLGTISDGDIRRYILRSGTLEGTVEQAMNPDPIVAFQDHHLSHTALRELFIRRSLSVLPVVDHEKRVVNYWTWRELFAEEDHPSVQSAALANVPVVIMAGGKGTRLDPFTRVLPKPLIPVGDKTIIEHIIDRFRQYGAQQFYITVNYKAEMLEAYFQGLQPPYDVVFVREPEFLGTAGSLALLRDTLSTDFILSNCDIILDIDFADLVSFHREQQSSLTSVVAIQHHRIPYGVVQMQNGGQIQKIIEKPEYTFPVNAGVYVMSPRIFQYLPEATAVDMPQLIDTLLQSQETVLGYPVPSSAYLDVGQWAEYKEAVKKLMMIE